MSTLTQKRLKELLDYDPNTGVFTWRVSTTNRVRVGGVAGTVHPQGYRQIRVDGRIHKAHRLAWLWMTGDWPLDQIDHINGVRADNRLANLRPATQSQNSANMRKHATSKSGYKGVSWSADRAKWQAAIKVNGLKHFLGRFTDPAAAHAAYVAAAEKHFGEFARVA
jgi:hypothetical protein